jgi:circadian clock protein KaiB
VTVSEPIVRCRLYVAGQASNSQFAVQNLTAFCQRYLPNRHHIEIVDVSVEQERAMADKIFLTPTLAIIAPPPSRFIIGDLSDGTVLQQAFSFEIATSDGGA